jgi:membrane-bound lytic murein transglycosylase MltF
MQFKRILAVMAALCVLAVPAVALAATAQTQTTTTTTPKATAAAKVRSALHRKAMRRNVRLARIHAHRTGRRVAKGYAAQARTRSLRELQRSNARLRARLDNLARQRAIVARLRPTLRGIALCESHHNPRAVSSTGKYRGLFQFDYTAWRSVGGKGDPASASVREQYYRAALLYRARGASPWPVCGR